VWDINAKRCLKVLSAADEVTALVHFEPGRILHGERSGIYIFFLVEIMGEYSFVLFVYSGVIHLWDALSGVILAAVSAHNSAVTSTKYELLI
jgi:hypothetical protein